MHYHISRNGPQYGPYTLEDIQRYVASGNILPTDMAKNGEMADWVPVSQLLPPAAAAPTDPFGNPSYASPVATPVYGQPAAPAQSAQAYSYQDPPNLNWGLYTLFAIITCTLFSKVFTVVQAAWLKRVQPNSNALLSYGIQYGIMILTIVVRAATHTLVQTTGPQIGFGAGIGAYAHQNPVVNLLNLLYLIMIFVSRFVMRASMEEHFNTVEPIGLRLSPVMTFFFGGIYFQYHINRIMEMKQVARFNAGRSF